MSDLGLHLVEFVFRLSFGMALAMALTSASLVTSGFFKNHSWVLMGLLVLATLVSWTLPAKYVFALAAAGAAISYIGSITWLYEAHRLGKCLLLAVSACAAAGAFQLATLQPGSTAPAATEMVWLWLDPLTSGLLLGTTITAMFLGHWYLNTPTMQLAPLKRLVLAMAAAVTLRGLVCAAGLALLWGSGHLGEIWPLLSLRWLAGILGTILVILMTWQTLKIPNTQSATGILYVGVIVTFLGELVSQLLSADLPYPV